MPTETEIVTGQPAQLQLSLGSLWWERSFMIITKVARTIAPSCAGRAVAQAMVLEYTRARCPAVSSAQQCRAIASAAFKPVAGRWACCPATVWSAITAR